MKEILPIIFVILFFSHDLYLPLLSFPNWSICSLSVFLVFHFHAFLSYSFIWICFFNQLFHYLWLLSSVLHLNRKFLEAQSFMNHICAMNSNKNDLSSSIFRVADLCRIINRCKMLWIINESSASMKLFLFFLFHLVAPLPILS